MTPRDVALEVFVVLLSFLVAVAGVWGMRIMAESTLSEARAYLPLAYLFVGLILAIAAGGAWALCRGGRTDDNGSR